MFLSRPACELRAFANLTCFFRVACRIFRFHMKSGMCQLAFSEFHTFDPLLGRPRDTVSPQLCGARVLKSFKGRLLDTLSPSGASAAGDRVGGNFSDKRNFRPLTPPCIPFGTRRFNQLNNKHALRRSSLPWRLIRIGLVSLLLQPCSSLRLGIHRRCAPHSTLLTRRISC